MVSEGVESEKVSTLLRALSLSLRRVLTNGLEDKILP